MADVALWLGPYISISSKNVICTKTQKVRKCRPITTNQNHTNQPDDPQIPSQIRFVKEEQQTRHTKGFFPSSLADVALWLGPYMSISGKTSLCTRNKTVWKCRQITTTTTTHNPARRPANPPARLAFRQEKQQTRQTKGAGAQTKTTTKKICQRTQWFDHCIILKNKRK